jgi:hypothetical protein
MRRETSRVAFLMCPFCVREPSSRQATLRPPRRYAFDASDGRSSSRLGLPGRRSRAWRRRRRGGARLLAGRRAPALVACGRRAVVVCDGLCWGGGFVSHRTRSSFLAGESTSEPAPNSCEPRPLFAPASCPRRTGRADGPRRLRVGCRLRAGSVPSSTCFCTTESHGLAVGEQRRPVVRALSMAGAATAPVFLEQVERAASAVDRDATQGRARDADRSGGGDEHCDRSLHGNSFR